MSSQHNKFGKSRRRFIKRSLAAAVFPAIVPSSVFGANAPSNRVAIGCIGTGGMGMADLRAFQAQPQAQIVAVCDVDSARLKSAQSEAKLPDQRAYGDFRELLEQADIDAVTVVTPDHWHVPISIAAAKAGKDIYCEKPLSLTIAEGRTLADTVHRYGRILQTGSQRARI